MKIQITAHCFYDHKGQRRARGDVVDIDEKTAKRYFDLGIATKAAKAATKAEKPEKAATKE